MKLVWNSIALLVSLLSFTAHTTSSFGCGFLCLVSRWPYCPNSSAPKIIAHNQTKNEPTGADRAFQRTADLRFSDAWVVAQRNFNHAVSSQRAFENHLNRPAIGGLFEGERA